MELAVYVDVKEKLPSRDRQLLDTTFKYHAKMRDSVREQVLAQSG